MPDIINRRDLVRIIEGRVRELARLIERCRALRPRPAPLREARAMTPKKSPVATKKPKEVAKPATPATQKPAPKPTPKLTSRSPR
jgi:hypothetical protein